MVEKLDICLCQTSRRRRQRLCVLYLPMLHVCCAQGDHVVTTRGTAQSVCWQQQQRAGVSVEISCLPRERCVSVYEEGRLRYGSRKEINKSFERTTDECATNSKQGQTGSKTCLSRYRTPNPGSLGLRCQKHDDALQNKRRVALQFGILAPGYQDRNEADTSGSGNMSRALQCAAMQSQLWHLMLVLSWVFGASAEERVSLHQSRGAVPLNLTSSDDKLMQLTLMLAQRHNQAFSEMSDKARQVRTWPAIAGRCSRACSS